MPAVSTAEFALYMQQTVDEPTATFLLTLAEALVVEVTGTLPTPASASVRAVILEMTRRAYVNPEGWTSEQIDDWAGRRDAGSAGIFLTDDELSILNPLTGRAYTIVPSYT